MTYIDTDVLVHSYVVQDEHKHNKANEVIERVVGDGIAVISTLSIQEMLFVLNRLRVDAAEVYKAYESLMRLQPVAYDTDELQRAVDIARHVGFRSINDCIHTAIAESHCTELITYNGQDFGRIRNFARIDITIL